MASRLMIGAAALAVAAAALVVSQLNRSGGDATTSATLEPGARAPSDDGYAALLDQIDRRIDGLRARANKRSDDWLTRMHLSTVLLERVGLTNQIDDVARVEEVLDEAFAIAPDGTGPLLSAARFNFSIHRLEVAESYLDKMDRAALQRREEQVAARLLRAEIAFQRGQYEAAFAGLTAVAAANPSAAMVELALYHAKTGDPAKAEVLLADALSLASTKDPRRRAWIRLQLGLVAMDRGQPLVAMAHLQQADAELPGWWLVQEHIAEVHSRIGNHGQATAIYEELVRSADLPQHLDALANAYQHAGRDDEAQELITRAAARWEAQLGRFPEAAMGHGLQHYLQFGSPQRALELALANYAVRPGGEAQVLLANAYLQSGKPAEALELVLRALATPYRTAGLHDVAARAHAAMGNTAAEQEQLVLRAAINPSYQGRDHTH